jgi:hypothetical protein
MHLFILLRKSPGWHGEQQDPKPILSWFKTPNHTALLQRLCPAPSDQGQLWAWCATRLEDSPLWLGPASPSAASKLLLLLYVTD